MEDPAARPRSRPRSPSPSQPPHPPPQPTRTPLPPSVRDEILSYLIPPRPPLPPKLLSRDFLERLTFLPPEEHDTDAQLSPFPSSADNALSHALASCELSPPSATQYSFDGTMLARTLVQPAALDMAGRKVEVSFATEPERGWVYRGAKFSIGEDDGWYDDVEEVPEHDAAADDDDDAEARAYWAGWTPTTSDTEASAEHDDEDAYWAQYGAGPDTSHDAYRAPTPAPAPVSAAAATAGDSRLEEPAETSAPSKPEAPTQPGVLEEKLTAKIKCQLLKAWTQFSAGKDAEAAVIDYLRVCREVNNRPAWGFVSTDADSASGSASDDDAPVADVKAEVLRTRVESVRDIFEVLGKQKDEFWRWCEEAIRVRSPPAQHADGPEDIEGC